MCDLYDAVRLGHLVNFHSQFTGVYGDRRVSSNCHNGICTSFPYLLVFPDNIIILLFYENRQYFIAKISIII